MLNVYNQLYHKTWAYDDIWLTYKHVKGAHFGLNSSASYIPVMH